ncbi:MAG: UDP-N-acetylglucosamine--N-acetylmuramyl-(pentapeptide) pyrophosphoryl-undecaprenol N-acetylglucosamine transferase, partial [uncultured Phycisphaerae bacterium]
MSEPLTIFLAGGGTGGHLYPGIAVAEALRAIDPTVRPVFLCTEREIDRVILTPTGFDFVPQPIVPPVTSVGGLLRFYKSWRETKDLVRQLLRERRPNVVLGLGGYAAGVAVKKAAERGIPTAVLNPDVIPGKANQFLMKVVRAVCCQFEATSRFVGSSSKAKLQVTGCPIRSDIAAPPGRDEAAKRLGIDPMLKTLVVTGASLGARTVNEAVLTLLGGMTLRGWQVLHLAGREHADAVRAGYRDLDVCSRVIDFTPGMADVWAASDLAISRSGASSCAELTACGVPSVLMPYPFHRDMHQRVNAEQLVDAGAAVLVDDDKDRARNAAKLKPVVEGLMYDADRR